MEVKQEHAMRKDPHPTTMTVSPPQASTTVAPNSKPGVSIHQEQNGDGHISFNRVDKYISSLANQVLPAVPHLLSVPTTTPFRPEFPYENCNTPFADWEVSQMQYMTLLSYDERGVARPRGNWEDEMVAASPESGGPQISPEDAGGRSGTATPHSERDPNRTRTKMSLADYKAGKRPPPQAKSVNQDVNTQTIKDVAKVVEPQNVSAIPPRKPHPLPSKVEAHVEIAPVVNGAKITKSVEHAPSTKRQSSAPVTKPSHSIKPSATTVEKRAEPKLANETNQNQEKMQADKKSQPAKTSVKNESETNSPRAQRGAAPMPPLLSPLPARLTSPERPSRTSPLRSIPQKTPTKSPEALRKTKIESSPLSPFPMPPLLSPTLPPNVERWLARSKANSLEGLHERSRDPDTPGVARKVKPSPAGHNSKDRKQESTNSTVPLSKIVKLKYKKRQAKDIQRILAMKARPRQEVPAAASYIKATLPSTSAMAQADDNKRPRSTEDQQEPSAKRLKIPSSIEIPKARTPIQPAFKSPTLSSSFNLQKPFSGTPKRGDAMKSVAMRKVDSSDGHARTPQPVSHSTPASAEKHKLNGSDPRYVEIENARAAYPKYLNLGQTLKRQTDQILKTREWVRTTVSEPEKKLSAVVAIEAIAAYMSAFYAHDTKAHLERKPNHGENWASFFPLLPFVTTLVQPYPELYVLILLLSGTCADALDKLYSERFASENPSSAPEYLKFRDEYSKNSRYRFKTWPLYHEQCILEGRHFSPDTYAAKLVGKHGITIPEVKTITVNVLKEFSGLHDVPWEMKIDF